MNCSDLHKVRERSIYDLEIEVWSVAENIWKSETRRNIWALTWQNQPSDRPDAQADLSLLRAHSHFVDFVMSQLISRCFWYSDVLSLNKWCHKYGGLSDRYMSCLMTKPTKWLCAQWRLKSAWASTKSDQCLSLCAQWVAKDPSFLHADSKDSDQSGGCPGWSESSLSAHAILLVLSWGGPHAKCTWDTLATVWSSSVEGCCFWNWNTWVEEFNAFYFFLYFNYLIFFFFFFFKIQRI